MAADEARAEELKKLAEVHSKPRSINLTYATVNGKLAAPIEIWVAAILQSLDPKALQIVLDRAYAMNIQRAAQNQPRIIANLDMPVQ